MYFIDANLLIFFNATKEGTYTFTVMAPEHKWYDGTDAGYQCCLFGNFKTVDANVSNFVGKVAAIHISVNLIEDVFHLMVSKIFLFLVDSLVDIVASLSSGPKIMILKCNTENYPACHMFGRYDIRIRTMEIKHQYYWLW